MFIMIDGRPYASDYCLNHRQLEDNFKGDKYKKEGTDPTSTIKELTDEFKKHLLKIKLDVVTIDGIKKAICPKCGMSIKIK